jgi:sulfoxide reductase heme-binding subunit YedZ
MPRIIPAKGVLFIVCLIPAGVLVYNGIMDNLGAEPIKEITHFTGDWTLYLLLTTLAITPLRKLAAWNELVRYRRLLGLFAFFYACLHFLTYFVLDQFFDWDEILRDIVKRPYITVGFSAFILLIPLALTSTNNMMKRLGKHWKRLHSLIYITGTLGILHFLWLVKADVRKPLLLGAVLVTLLVLRLPYVKLKIRRAASLKNRYESA